MKRILILFLMSAAVIAARVQVQAQHVHVRYFDKDGNPVEERDHDHEDGDHEEHDHDDHSNESVRELFEGVAKVVYGEEGRTVTYAFTGLAPRFGLAVQKSLFAEVGTSLDFYRLGYTEASEYVTFAYSNLRPYVSGEIMVGRELLGGGKAGVEFIMSTPILGMAAGIDGSYLTDGVGDAVLLTPRLMLSFVYVEVFYGYNFFIRNELTRRIGHHRFGVSMTLNQRFWKRKKAIYNDYYNSYLE